MVATRLMTPDDLFTMSDEEQKDYELVDGVLVEEPSVVLGHGRMSVRFITRIAAHVESHELGEVFDADTQFILGPNTVRRPDVSFISSARLPPEAEYDQRYRAAPDLAVEVISPANTSARMDGKIRDYFAAGCRLVWVVDWQQRTIAVHAPNRNSVTLGPEGELDGEDVLPGFRLRIGELF